MVRRCPSAPSREAAEGWAAWRPLLLGIAGIEPATEPRPEGWWGQFERYADALDAGAVPPVTLADARASIELITALYDSARRGVDVTLPLSADHPLYEGWLP